jgi:alpha-tubulin suppressor-like RCC1 family protein
MGQLGDGTIAGTDTCERSTRCRPAPAPVVGADKLPLKDIARISASFWHACAIKKGGSVHCWGSNEQGQLGHSGGDMACTNDDGASVPCNPTPTQVGLPGGISAASVSVGLRYSCVATTGGDVYCWGHNPFGQIGQPLATASTPIPSRVTGLPGRATQIAVADQGDSSCALLADRTVWCWGNSFRGGTGHDPSGDPACGTVTCNPVPKRIDDGHGMAFGGVDAIGIARYGGCALKAGAVFCWGDDSFGTLGNGAASAADPVPRLVSGLPAVRSIAFADLTVLAVAESGDVWSWGRNNFGTVGDGTIAGDGCTQACRWSPTKAKIANAARIAVGSATAVTLTTSGAIWIWGNNSSAQLGHLPGAAGDLSCGQGAAPEHCNPVPAKLAWPL